MIDKLIHVVVIFGQVLFLWTILACLVAPIIGGYLRNRDRDGRREAEEEAARWARKESHRGRVALGGSMQVAP